LTTASEPAASPIKSTSKERTVRKTPVDWLIENALFEGLSFPFLTAQNIAKSGSPNRPWAGLHNFQTIQTNGSDDPGFLYDFYAGESIFYAVFIPILITWLFDNRNREVDMEIIWDIVYMASTILFFWLTGALLRGLGKLQGGKP
jgi:hypothetical protein